MNDRSSLIWLFDLDNTLHDASFSVFKQIDVSMTNAVMKHLNVSKDQANYYRQKYWEKYGATLIGMQRHHQVNPKAFLKSSHDFDIAAHIKPEPYLNLLFQTLPGKKFIYTNAPKDYAEIVLNTLNIDHHIEKIFAIDDMKIAGIHYPKPSVSMLKRVLHQLSCPPHQIIFVEDTLKNLKPAKQIGMRTVYLFHPHTPFSSKKPLSPRYMDFRIKDIRSLPDLLKKI
ncbi:pyrimidine 5'-nucleotidase [Basilea psittacipulmonis]|uniref:Hydrolase n=1 Tax=Basilea psittacipulmonis DSM 24701 TaxID=1072685 RepID=A0A077DBT7_9BURK|nr:pyrimidine 5'-nucleotidase [Basilea psittacipulmonis]AIL32124.1 hypothetical protein IX83_01210 [Basilea psittacipulmonis DSM 24701]